MDGEAPSPPTQGESAGPTTTSAMPIAPVFAGAMVSYNFRDVLRATKQQLLSEQFYKRYDPGTDIKNPYVPAPAGPRGGIEVQRHMAGIGIPFMDPLDNFKPGRLEINKRSSPVRRPSRPLDSSRIRKKGAAVYRKNNKENIDYGQEM